MNQAKPGIHWLFIALAVVSAGIVVLYFSFNLDTSLFIGLMVGGIGLTVAIFFVSRMAAESAKNPDGWADPVVDSKKARKEMDLPTKADKGADGSSRARPSASFEEYATELMDSEPIELVEEFLQMGRLLLKSGRYGEARDTFVQATQQDEGNSKAYNYLGIACGRLNLFDEAIDAYNKAIALDYDYASVHFNLATVYDQMNDKENALVQWKRYLEVGKVLGEREDMLDRAKGRLQALKEGTDRIKKKKIIPPSDSSGNHSD